MDTDSHYIATPAAAYPSRRSFLRQTGGGFGALALAAMLSDDTFFSRSASGAATSVGPLEPRSGNFTPRATSVIWLFMNGGQSQIDTWDFKPQLARHDGQKLEGFDKNTGFFTDQ